MSLFAQDIDFTSNWKKVKDQLQRVIRLQHVEGMVLFEYDAMPDVYRICAAQSGYSERLYNKLNKFLIKHAKSLCESLLEKQSDILADYLAKWQKFDVGCRYTHNICNYLNNHWIKNQINERKQKLAGPRPVGRELAPILTIYPLSLLAWKTHLFDPVYALRERTKLMDSKTRLIRELLQTIQRERNGERVEQNELVGIITSFVRMGLIHENRTLKVYREDFEEAYLTSLKSEYSIESTNFLAENGVVSYMRRCLVRLDEESRRSLRYLDPSSAPKVDQVVNEVLITNHAKALLNEFEDLLRDEKLEDLNRMLKLFTRIPLEQGILPMRDALTDYVTASGLARIKVLQESGQLDAELVDAAESSMETASRRGKVQEAKKTKAEDGEEADDSAKGGKGADGGPSTESKAVTLYVTELLSIHRQFTQVVQTGFDNESHFVAALDKSCRTILNENAVSKDTSKSPELLAKFADLQLRKGGQHQDETERDEKLQQTILLFKYLDDKDIFQKFYSKLLTKRLINGTSVSEDAEKLMIAGLKDVCGFEYTSKLQRMFTDIQLSHELNEQFKQWITTLSPPSISSQVSLLLQDSSMMVLTSGAWPLFGGRSSFRVPIVMQEGMEVFQKFYDQKHHGRRLAWLHQLSKGDLKMLYCKKKYEVQVTVHQLGVLVLFNDADALTESEISSQTMLEAGELRLTIKSLLQARLLLRNETGKFSLNMDFKSSMFTISNRLKFKVTAPLPQENLAQNAAARKAVLEDRKIFLMAAIVRIMKSRQVMRHAELMAEVIAQSRNRFQPNVTLIKRTLEQLIEKEYIARTDNGESYSYVA